MCFITYREIFSQSKYFNFLFTPGVPSVNYVQWEGEGQAKKPSCDGPLLLALKRGEAEAATPHVDDNARSFSSPRSWILYLN